MKLTVQKASVEISNLMVLNINLKMRIYGCFLKTDMEADVLLLLI